MKWWKKAMRAMEKPEENKKLKKWQGKFENSKSKYQDELDRMEMQKKYYIGDRHVKGNPNKEHFNIYNLTFKRASNSITNINSENKHTSTMNCPNCGVINDVDRHGKTRCDYYKTIIEHEEKDENNNQ